MNRKFSLKLCTGYKLVYYPENIFVNEDTHEVVEIPESKEWCLRVKEFVFYEDLNEPIFEVRKRFEDIHEIFTQQNLKRDQKKRDELILNKNIEQVKIAYTKLTTWKKNKFANSFTISRRIQYLETALSEFEHWFSKNILPFPEYDSDNNSSNLLINKPKKELKEFGYGELKQNLKILLKEMNINEREPLNSKQKYTITERLKKKGFNAKFSSVSTTLYGMGHFSEY